MKRLIAFMQRDWTILSCLLLAYAFALIFMLEILLREHRCSCFFID